MGVGSGNDAAILQTKAGNGSTVAFGHIVCWALNVTEERGIVVAAQEKAEAGLWMFYSAFRLRVASAVGF